MFALEDRQVVWKFSPALKVEGDAIRGPPGATPLDTATWKNAPGTPTRKPDSYTSPRGNPAPDFAIAAIAGGVITYTANGAQSVAVAGRLYDARLANEDRDRQSY
jgi:hypothetical protein